jgi:hypothetical protein
LLILVTSSSESALEVQALVEAEAALRDLLGEPAQHVNVVAADSIEQAELILGAIRADESFPPYGVQVHAVPVP